jgi:general stress protein 26
MDDASELESKLWSSLSSHRVVMLGLDSEGGASRPMTVQMEEARGPLWFFTAKESSLVQGMSVPNRATATFTAKNGELFATIEGPIVLDDERPNIDRLWNRHVAVWYPEGKNDPHLALLRLTPVNIHIWSNDASAVTGFKVLLGADPRKEQVGSEARVRL